MITGVDLSSYQHPRGAPIDYALAHHHGVDFAIIEFKDELGAENAFFIADHRGFRGIGVPTGSYVFVRPELPTLGQAEDLRSLAKYGPVWADLETTGGRTAEEIRAFWAELHNQAPDCVLVSYPAFLRANGPLPSPPPLWIDSFGAPKAPAGARLWGMTDKAEVPGIPGPVDLDGWVGTEASFAQAFESGGARMPEHRMPLRVAAAAGTGNGLGYWLAEPTGRVLAYGDAAYHGSPAKISGDVAAILATPGARGYRVVTSTGEVHDFGDARPERMP